MARLTCSAWMLVLLGCGRIDYAPLGTPAPLDGGRDAAGIDAANIDAAATDAAGLDAASTDAASTDAASTDAASTDAASTDAASDGGPCGVIGNACCSGATECLEGGCLGGTCASMGGSYVDRIMLSDRSCEQPNPLTGSCTCPLGFARSDTFEVYRNEATFQILELFFCRPAASAPAGLVAACERCTCPAPAVTGDHSCPFTGFYMDSFVTCSGPQAEGDTFGGAYSEMGPTCDRPNPYTGACSCPPGAATTELDLGCRAAVLCWMP